MSNTSPVTQFCVTLDDIQRAEELIRTYVIRTPLVDAWGLQPLTGCRLRFNCEYLQHGYAFKARGACNAVFSLSDEEASRGVVRAVAADVSRWLCDEDHRRQCFGD